MTTDTPAPPHPKLQAIAAQQEHLQGLRARHAREQAVEQRKLAVLIQSTKDDPDPAVNPSAAARAMGTAKGWAHALVKRLEAGELDVPEDGEGP